MCRMHCVLNMLLLFAFRTSVSIHLMEWSPDGEYFATAGKVREQSPPQKNKYSNKTAENSLMFISSSVFHKLRLFCTASLRHKNVCEAGDIAQWWQAVVPIGEVLSSILSSVKWKNNVCKRSGMISTDSTYLESNGHYYSSFIFVQLY